MNRIVSLIVLLVPLQALAQVEPIALRPTAPQSGFRLTVDPVAPPTPSLKFELLPPPNECQPGNAALYHQRATLVAAELPPQVRTQFEERYRRWTENPLAPSDVKEVREWLEWHQAVIGELRTAAYREKCEFDHQLRGLSSTESLNFRLPEIQAMRQLGRVLRIKARLEIQEGRFDDALDSMRIGFRTSRDAATSPLTISGVIGIASASATAVSLAEWSAASNSPNLYWAISALPRPLVDIRHGLQHERRLVEQFYPAMKDAEHSRRSAEEWNQEFAKAFLALMSIGSSQDNRTEDDKQWSITNFLLKAYPSAKRQLIAAGFDPQRVESLPPAQVVTIQTERVARYACDELLKWLAFPTHQALAGLEASESKLRQENILREDPTFSQGALPIVPLVMPYVYAVRLSQARLENTLAVYQLIEVLRWHAATEGGKLPATLADIKVAPVPRDPLTGEPFVYRLESGMAVIDVQSLAKLGTPGGVRYEIAIRKRS